jgi:hypothetical protein
MIRVRFANSRELCCRSAAALAKNTGQKSGHLPWIGAALVLISVAAVLKGFPTANLVPPFLGGISLVVWPLFGHRWIVRLAWKKMPYADKEFVWTFSDEELRCDIEGERSSFDWVKVARVNEDKEGFWLSTQPMLGHWIPKCAFSSESDLESFRTLARSKTEFQNA